MNYAGRRAAAICDVQDFSAAAVFDCSSLLKTLVHHFPVRSPHHTIPPTLATPAHATQTPTAPHQMEADTYIQYNTYNKHSYCYCICLQSYTPTPPPPPQHILPPSAHTVTSPREHCASKAQLFHCRCIHSCYSPWHST